MRSADFLSYPVHRWLGLCALTLLALALPVLLPPAAQASDAVEALRRYLQLRRVEPTATVLKEREKQLKQHVAALKTVSELRQALELPQWRDSGFVAADTRAVDQAAQAEVGRRLEKVLTEAARKGDVTRRLAVAHAIGAMGTDNINIVAQRFRARKGDDGASFRPQKGFASSLAPLLIVLCQDREPAVRRAAARALGRINPDPPTAAAALKALFGNGDTGTRRAAAEALGSLVELPTPFLVESPAGAGGFGKGGLGKKATKKGGGGVAWSTKGSVRRLRGRLTTQEILDAGKDVVGVAATGLGDSDPQVRALCLEAFHRTAVALCDEVSSTYYPPGYFSSAGGALTPLQQRRLETAAKAMAAHQEQLRPLFGAWYEHGASLRRALRSQDTAANQKSAEILQILALARAQLLLQWADNSPALAGKKIREDPLGAVVLLAVPDLAEKLTHADVGVRTACVNALNALGIDAAPAAEALVKALKDKDGTVRATAVMALWRVGPEPLSEALAAKVALELVACAGDDNKGVRDGALTALQRFRLAAAPAVGELTRTLPKADARTQLLILQALEEIGANAKVAVPALTTALMASEPEVRAAAARALGRFGRDAAPATKALVAALDDANVSVRQAASEALLTIGE